jgi:hypothetical protein
MCKLICPLCNEVIKTGQVRKEWWMSDTDKRIAHACCITAYEKGVVKGKSVVNEDLEFAYKRAKVLADLLEIPVHESPEVTGTILGLVRGSVERLITKNKDLAAYAKIKTGAIHCQLESRKKAVAKVREQAMKDAIEAVDAAGGDSEDYHIEVIKRKFGLEI